MADAGREYLDWTIPEDVPEGRCGFTVEHVNAPIFPGNVTCWRKSWEGYDRCIWHADVADKPADELAAARADTWERFDGVVLQKADIEKTVSFVDCTLIGANCAETNFCGGDLAGALLMCADLTEINLEKSDCTDADFLFANVTDGNMEETDLSDAALWATALNDTNLFAADLANAKLTDSDLSDAFLGSANLTNALLERAQFADAVLENADLTDANLRATDFSNGVLNNVDLTGAICKEAELTNAYLEGADLTDADLREANLTNADLRKVAFDGANLENADLSEADLRDSSFVDARLHETFLDDARSNADTDLRDAHAYDLPELQPAEADTLSDHLRMNLQTARHYLSPSRDDDATDPAKSVRVHRKLQQLLRENALPGEIPHHYVREKHARRRQAIIEGDYLKWGYAALQRWVAGYGESPWRVVATSLAIIVGSALLYPIWGLTVDKASAPIRVVEYGAAPTATVYELGKSFYFSVITFTTLGYGDIQPRGFAETLATVESFLGALLMALLVAVLARRITR